MQGDAALHHGRPGGPRILLKALREAMAESLGPQERLDRIVQQVAAAMGAEVCSVYVRRADDILELFATQGLKPEAVHLSQLRVGQGLVGSIAAAGRPLNLRQAQTHPAFAYLPETGEDPFQSFLGVPMKRGGHPLGVLTIQTRETRTFSDEDVEALETAAMVLCDLVASGELGGLSAAGTALEPARPFTTRGARLSPGIGMGRVVLHEPRVVVERFFADDEEDEIRRLATAMRDLRASVDELVTRPLGNGAAEANGDHVDVLEAYRMFAHDAGWVRRIEAAIRSGLTAEAAVQKVAQENRARLMRSPDPYLRERRHDFDDLARRLLKSLMGEDARPRQPAEGAVVLARTMGAAELLDYDPVNLRGLVLEEATATSHVVIVARALGIPVVGQVPEIVTRAGEGDPVVVDGDMGRVHLRPPEEVVATFQERLTWRAERDRRFDAQRTEPSITTDGERVDLLLNAGLSVDLPLIESTGASGIGLFRTELQFMVSARLPRLDEQVRFYRSVLDAAGEKPVTFRTLDVGGDKVLPYLRTVKEDNPALGWRAIRLAIDRPGLLRMQLRALIKAAAGRALKIKLPMVTMVSEVEAVRALLEREMENQSRFGHALPASVKLGAMIEVPSLLFQLDALMAAVDFVSVGSNDLFQFFVASDRTNVYLADRFDPLSRPFLRALREVARAGRRNGVPVQVCGEMAGDPLAAMALVGVGYRALSMAPTSVGPVKETVRALDAAALTALVEAELDDAGARDHGPQARALSERLAEFARAHDIPLQD